MEQEFMLRNLINMTGVNNLSERISKIYHKFDKANFIKEIDNEINKLNFGDRSKLICEALKKHLPDEYKKAVDILVKSLNQELKSGEIMQADGFIIMPLCLFVSKYGVSDENYDISINALYEMTKRFSAEFDIRPFLIKYPEKTHKILLKWSKDSNTHVRRLSSEGSRPRLPLGIRLPMYQKNPKPVIEILENLKEDKEIYVRRSVANNLNDIAKDNPQIVIETLKKWNEIKTEEMNWIIKHSLRTLIKDGNKEALELLGYNCTTDILVKNISLDKRDIEVGKDFSFSFEVTSLSKKENLMIDYIIHHMKANGKNKEKVFKLAKKILLKNQTLKLSKKHSFKPISTRKYYKGKHYLEIKINGKNYFMEEFNLI